MNSPMESRAWTSCASCPIRDNPHFRDFDEQQLKFITRFKTGELNVDPGATILVEGANSAHLYTVLSGCAFRYKVLGDGRRQILNFAVPGDLIGLQGTLMDEMQHSVEALTPLKLCVFERARLEEVYRNHPDLAFDITWIAAREERILDEHLLSVGRRTALERAAYLIAFVHRRGTRSGLLRRKPHILPLTQQHVADTLGLSVVHTNKTLKKLAERQLIAWRDGGCVVLEPERLAALAGWDAAQDEDARRPFL